jgi:hypothetical protein
VHTKLDISFSVVVIIVLINGCFHNCPVICPRSLKMAQEVCIGPSQRRGLIHVLINVCFHNGPVMCPRSLIIDREACISPRR